MRAIALVALALALVPLPARAARGESIVAFVTHAAQFSLDTRERELVEPQVFVADASAPAASTGIAHRAGLRSARLADDPSSPALMADGTSLGMTVGTWFGARGTLVIDMSLPAAPRIRATFNGLVPRGAYTIVETIRRSERDIDVLPAGGSAYASFVADESGRGDITVSLRAALAAGAALHVVYHAPAAGAERTGNGEHEQLTYRAP